MKILIKNGLIIDPATNLEQVLDIFIEDTKILKISKNIDRPADLLIDAKDKIIMPGIIDMHVHLREPGREDKETILTGTLAASRGGVTGLLAMPNTTPPIDSAKNIKLLSGIIKKSAIVDVYIAGTITLGRMGKNLSDIKALRKAGAIAISDDGSSVDDAKLMLKALIQSKKEKMLVISHCEDRSLSKNGVVNLGFTSTRLGLRGVSNESEYRRVERDIKLAEKAASSIHIAHVSCRESVDIIRKAKKRGVKVTAETAPHYFSLSEEDVLDYNTNMKVNPPLRSKDDVIAIKEALKDGTIDVIASDHAPHTENEKDIEFEFAETGTIGLETELAVSITELVLSGILNWSELVKKISYNPARILGIDKGRLKPGHSADLIIVSPYKEWVVRKEDFLSKSKNSAFLGRSLKGAVEYTIYNGKIVYSIEKHKTLFQG